MAPRDMALLPVVFARNLDEAQTYGSVLAALDIPVWIGGGGLGRGARGAEPGASILVPESCHARACEIIASHDAAHAVDEEEDDDTFYDDDEDDEDVDDEEEDDDDLLEDGDEDVDEDDDDDDWDD